MFNGDTMISSNAPLTNKCIIKQNMLIAVKVYVMNNVVDQNFIGFRVSFFNLELYYIGI